ncbi:MAG: hypothetical protein HQL69_15275 [Magnetococcales bacterium]|nr:hypothetical protein [Magnetococcales bacterium]
MKDQSLIQTDRRQVLVRLLSLGLLAGVAPTILTACGGAKKTHRIKPGVNEMGGEVLIDGVPATPGMIPKNNSTIETGPESMLAMVLGLDAFLIRENSRIRFTPKINSSAIGSMLAQADGQNSVVADSHSGPKVVVSKEIVGFALDSGKVLSVFAPGKRILRTPSINIGIRGTGIYIESSTNSGTENSYICTCYGTVDIQSLVDPSVKETVVSKHHDAPKTITSSPNRVVMEPAKFVNHTDAELRLIEAFVGRTPPFAAPRSTFVPNMQPQHIQTPVHTHTPTTTTTPTHTPVSVPMHHF